MVDSKRMTSKRFLIGTLAMMALAAAAVTAVGDRREVVPEVVAGSSENVHSILAALPIGVTSSFAHDWSAERAQVSSGWLLALEVNPELLVRHQSADPVLYVGDLAVERINSGDLSGRVIVLVPERIDLATAPIFFGAAALPESVDTSTRKLELTRATNAGAKPFAASALEAALERGFGGSDAETVEFQDRRAVLEFAAQWIFEFAPEESDFAKELLLL